MTPHQKASQEMAAQQKKKDDEQKKKAELNNLFRPVQTISKGKTSDYVIATHKRRGFGIYWIYMAWMYNKLECRNRHISG